jgi:hypothetical protein
MPTIHDQLMAKCEEARDTYSKNHPERVKIEAQIEKLKLKTERTPHGKSQARH